MMAAPRISVIIPTYQRRDAVGRALVALSRQTLPPEDYEVIVSIDGSQDGTREAVAEFRAPFPLRTLWQRNAGRAAACNAGCRAARGELLVLLDDDMRPAPEFLTAHLAAHQSESPLGVVGAVPIALEASSSAAARFVGEKFNRHLARLAAPGYEMGIKDFYSGNFSIRRGVLLEAGGFDESFTIYGHEDVELALRLLRGGIRCH